METKKISLLIFGILFLVFPAFIFYRWIISFNCFLSPSNLFLCKETGLEILSILLILHQIIFFIKNPFLFPKLGIIHIWILMWLALHTYILFELSYLLYIYRKALSDVVNRGYGWLDHFSAHPNEQPRKSSGKKTIKKMLKVVLSLPVHGRSRRWPAFRG